LLTQYDCIKQKNKTVVNWKEKEQIHGEAGGGHLSGAGRIVTLVNRGEQESTSYIMLLINRLIRDIGLKRAFDALFSHSVTLVNRGEQECAACITWFIKRLIRAIGIKRIFHALLSHSPPLAQPLSLGITRISRKGRLFPTIFGPNFFCEMCQHFCRQITTPPLSSRYMMIKTDHNIKGFFLTGYKRDSSKHEADYHAKMLTSTA